MSDLISLKEAANKLSDYFDEESLQFGLSEEALLKQLTEVIVFLLLHNMEKLLSILYRIDVAERDTKAAFAENNPRQIAPKLAKLVLQRELQKAETRLAYRNPKN